MQEESYATLSHFQSTSNGSYGIVSILVTILMQLPTGLQLCAVCGGDVPSSRRARRLKQAEA